MHDNRSRTGVELVSALLGPGPASAEALAVIDRSRRVGADIMDVLVHRFSGDPEHPYRRAAELLGVVHVTEMADGIAPLGDIRDIDSLGALRSLRGRHEGKDVLFLAPRFEQFSLLHASLAGNLEMAGRICIVSPTTLRAAIARTNEPLLFGSAIQRLAKRFPFGSAHLDLSMPARLIFVLAVIVAIFGLVIDVPFVGTLIFGFLSATLVAPSLFRIWAAVTYGRNRPLMPSVVSNDGELPIYTVMIPLRDEAHMVPQIAAAMRALDYPCEKLDIMFVVESTSPLTLSAVRDQLGDPRFSLIVVPKRPPFTKPKALNFALPLARGEHIVVFDAEDIPEPSQLRFAASLFEADTSLECLQAELLIVPSSRGFLARMFAAEYAGHFGVLLPAIARANLPTPLGGTSNHFRTETLRRIGAWDAFNVTEDADLGIRMARLGLRIENFASFTWEEAPETASTWIRQRSRWMKGWIQTLLVHSRRPLRLLSDLSWRNLIAFYIFVGGMVLSTAVHALFLIAILILLCTQTIIFGAPTPGALVGLVSLAIGYVGAWIIAVIGLERLKRGGRILAIAGLPIYWLFAWCALLMALYELIKRPYHWQKTSHKGLPEGTSPVASPIRPSLDP